jgi:hypothetical protein
MKSRTIQTAKPSSKALSCIFLNGFIEFVPTQAGDTILCVCMIFDGFNLWEQKTLEKQIRVPFTN